MNPYSLKTKPTNPPKPKQTKTNKPTETIQTIYFPLTEKQKGKKEKYIIEE